MKGIATGFSCQYGKSGNDRLQNNHAGTFLAGRLQHDVCALQKPGHIIPAPDNIDSITNAHFSGHGGIPAFTILTQQEVVDPLLEAVWQGSYCLETSINSLDRISRSYLQQQQVISANSKLAEGFPSALRHHHRQYGHGQCREQYHGYDF